MPNITGTDIKPKVDIPIKNKRYQIPRYPLQVPMDASMVPVAGTGMLVPWTRVSTIIDTHKDKEGIVKWRSRLVVKGIGAREDLYALAAATRLEEKYQLSQIADQAFDYAKGQAAANLGSALHGFLERFVRGDKDLTIPSQWKADVAAVMTAFQDAGIELVPELQELVVVRPDLKDGDSGGMAGRFDLVVRWKGQLTMADYKTGSDPLEYGALEIQDQLGIYPTGWAIWDGEYWHPMPKIRRDKVLMVHVLPGQASVQIHEIDVDPDELEQDFAAAYRTRKRRKEAKKAHRPIVTVEDGALVDVPAGTYLDVPGDGTVKLLATPVTEVSGVALDRVEISSSGVVVKSAEMLEQARIRDGHLAKVSAAMKPNTEGDDEPKSYAEGAPEITAGRQVPTLGGDGKPLALLALPGERGCGVCGRKGHRRTSKVCLGSSDPRLLEQSLNGEYKIPATMTVEDEARLSYADGARPVTAGPCAHGAWTKGEQGWECGLCGAPSALPVAGPKLSALVDQEMSDGDHDSRASALRVVSQRLEDADRAEQEVLDPVTVASVDEGLAAAVRVSALPDPPADETDPFDEDGSDALKLKEPTWLERVQAAEDKADLREIRAQAQAAGAWTPELLQAGLERMKTFA